MGPRRREAARRPILLGEAVQGAGQNAQLAQHGTHHDVVFALVGDLGEGFVDWEWLDKQPARSALAHVRYVHLDEPMSVTMNGKKGEAVIRLAPKAD